MCPRCWAWIHQFNVYHAQWWFSLTHALSLHIGMVIFSMCHLILHGHKFLMCLCVCKCSCMCLCTWVPRWVDVCMWKPEIKVTSLPQLLYILFYPLTWGLKTWSALIQLDEPATNLQSPSIFISLILWLEDSIITPSFYRASPLWGKYLGSYLSTTVNFSFFFYWK